MDRSSKRFTTDELTGGLIRTRDLKRYMTNHEHSMTVPTLTAHLKQLLTEKGLRRADVIVRADIDRTFGYQIFDGSKSPSRDKLLQLAIGFGLNYPETCELLRIARKPALYARLRREAIIIYCISHGLSILETQYMLTEAELTPLGREKDR